MKTIRIKTMAATSVCVLAGLVASLGAPWKW
jgi:hypothetical protein